MNQHYTKDDMYLANIQMKKCSTSWNIREIHLKPQWNTAKYSLKGSKFLKTVSTTGKDIEEPELSYTASRENHFFNGYCLRERQRQSTSRGRAERERETQNRKQGSRLWTVSRVRRSPTNRKIMTNAQPTEPPRHPERTILDQFWHFLKS